MIKRIVIFLFFGMCVVALFHTAGAEPLTGLPEWFYKTSPGNRIGAIGFSYRYTADRSVKPKQIARLNAVFSLKGIIGPIRFDAKKKQIFELILGTGPAVNFSNGTLFAGGSFRKNVSVFEYVYFEPATTENPTDEEPPDLYSPTCQFQECKPGWLCNQANGERAGFLGVSYRASSPGRQLEITSKNALDLIEYMLGVDIEGKERYYRLNSSVIKINYRSKSYKITKNKKTKSTFIYTKAQCVSGHTLFSWKVSNTIPAYPTASSREWIKTGSVNGLIGAVGVARNDLTGFISRQLRQAYENGIAELSKMERVQVRSAETHRRGGSGQTRSEYDIRIDFENRVKPRISGVYMDAKKRLFVWVTPEKPLL